MAKRLEQRNIKKTVIIVILLIGVVVALGFLIKSLGTAAAIRSLPFTNDENYAFTGKGFVYISRGQLNYFDLSDEDRNYSWKFNQEDACVSAAEKITVIHNSRALRVAGTQYNIEVNGTVIKICCGANYAAVLRRGDDGSIALKVFDSTGTQCYEVKPENNDMLIDFGFENGGSSTLWTSQLIAAGDSFTTTVTTHDLSRKSDTGVFSVANQLVKNVFITKKSIFLFCTHDIIRYDRSTYNESYRILAYGYECLSASFSGGKGQFVLKNKGVGSNVVRLLTLAEDKTAGESAYLITLPSDTLESLVMNGKFVVVTPDELKVYTINDGKKELLLKHTEKFERFINAALKLSETKLLLTRGSEQLLYPVK